MFVLPDAPRAESSHKTPTYRSCRCKHEIAAPEGPICLIAQLRGPDIVHPLPGRGRGHQQIAMLSRRRVSRCLSARKTMRFAPSPHEAQVAEAPYEDHASRRAWAICLDSVAARRGLPGFTVSEVASSAICALIFMLMPLHSMPDAAATGCPSPNVDADASLTIASDAQAPGHEVSSPEARRRLRRAAPVKRVTRGRK